jgi:hypothetical protein
MRQWEHNLHPSQYRMLEPDNPWHPLPRDYPQLTADGQRQARLWALSQQDTPHKFVAAWDLFRRLYLQTTEPGFFYHNFAPSPDLHYELIYYAAKYARNLVGAPRGFAKSVVIGTELPMLLALTRPRLRIAMGLATDKLVEERFDQLMIQFSENPFIREDFGLQKGGRGGRVWNRHMLHMANGTKISGFSVTGRKRGARPDVFILDDPEHDPDTEGGAEIMRDKFEVFLFKQVIPMLEKGSAAYWIGTIIGRRSFLAHACYGDDQRFKYWNRMVYAAEGIDEQTGSKKLLWETKWDEEMLEVRRREIGEANYASEYLNTLSSPQDKVLQVDERLNEYTVEGSWEEFIRNPLSSQQMVRYWAINRKTRALEERREKAGELFTKMYRIMTHDPAKGLQSHHDYSCLAVMGFDRDNVLWVLDMWMGRAKELTIQRQIWSMGLRWMPKLIGIESVAKQISLVDSANTFLQNQLAESAGIAWSPRVVGVDYSRTDKDKTKADRISTLEWRFPTGCIKYPAHRKEHWPFNQLYLQTENFTYDLGLLPFDDAIDSVAMSHYVIHNRGVYQQPQEETATLETLINRGDLKVAGLPIIGAYGSAGLTENMIEKILDASSRYPYNKQNESTPGVVRGRRRLTVVRRPHAAIIRR